MQNPSFFHQASYASSAPQPLFPETREVIELKRSNTSYHLKRETRKRRTDVALPQTGGVLRFPSCHCRYTGYLPEVLVTAR
jgi:hypothetical protein